VLTDDATQNQPYLHCTYAATWPADDYITTSLRSGASLHCSWCTAFLARSGKPGYQDVVVPFALQVGQRVRAARIEEDIPLNPFTAGVYVATMMATVYVLKQKVLLLYRHDLSCSDNHSDAGRVGIGYAHAGRTSHS
jgi:hypothetical protein